MPLPGEEGHHAPTHPDLPQQLPLPPQGLRGPGTQLPALGHVADEGRPRQLLRRQHPRLVWLLQRRIKVQRVEQLFLGVIASHHTPSSYVNSTSLIEGEQQIVSVE